MVLKVPKYLSILQSFGVFLDNYKDDYTLITSKFGVINTFYLLLLYAFNFKESSLELEQVMTMRLKEQHFYV